MGKYGELQTGRQIESARKGEKEHEKKKEARNNYTVLIYN